jgi:hypothetical protein
MLIAIIAGLEAMVVYAARSKQGRARRQQLLMGTSTDLHRAALPLVDDYLKQKTARASRFQRFIASKLAALCRHVVHTRSFEFLVLHLVRAAINKRRERLNTLKRRITL